MSAYINKAQMKPFTYYLGSGRGSDVGFWDGDVFWIFREKFGRANSTTCAHWDDGGPFVPVQEIVSPWAGVVSGRAKTEEVVERLERIRGGL